MSDDFAERDADPRLVELRQQIGALVGEYVTALDAVNDMGPNIPTSWVLVVGMVELDWTDGRERTAVVHDRTPYTTRLGLLTTAQADLLK